MAGDMYIMWCKKNSVYLFSLAFNKVEPYILTKADDQWSTGHWTQGSTNDNIKWWPGVADAIITSHVSGGGNVFGPVCLSVHLPVDTLTAEPAI